MKREELNYGVEVVWLRGTSPRPQLGVVTALGPKFATLRLVNRDGAYAGYSKVAYRSLVPYVPYEGLSMPWWWYNDDDTPMANKWADEGERISAVFAFLEWMSEPGYRVCYFQMEGSNGEPRYIRIPRVKGERPPGEYAWEATWDGKEWERPNPAHESWPEGYWPVRKTRESLVAEWLGIDLDQLERERRQILNVTRAMNVFMEQVEANDRESDGARVATEVAS